MGGRAAFRPDRPSVAELAAGGVVRRRRDGRILLIHQRDDDRWCLPKGHVEPGENLAETARREIAEETGLIDLVIGEEIAEVHYRIYQPGKDRNVVKTVVYFAVASEGLGVQLEPGFDREDWVSLTSARRLVKYESDRAALRPSRRSVP
jgi:8-oxo-dGTP pyrophosphatase MutT (NUDIX family)